jgi:hypothetical protein
MWILAIFVMAPLIAMLSILANVIVSSRVSDVRSAQQIGSLVVLPIILFFILILTQSSSTSVNLMGCSRCYCWGSTSWSSSWRRRSSAARKY